MTLKTMTKQEKKELEYYVNSNQATLFSFKNVIDNNDYRYLLKLKDYDSLPEISQELEDELANAWYDIYNEYSEITGDSSATLQFGEMKRQSAKRHKIAYLSRALEFVLNSPEPEIIEIINNEGFNIDVSSEESFKKTFDAALGKLSKMQLQLKRSEPEQIENKDSFEGMISELEKFQGYQFKDFEMSVVKFAHIVKRYKNNVRQNK